ncbi:IS4 family transposase [Candidatus Protofrankia californiensis]|uniref:IS4 family transposase n=1 Tax=Candidatus Protofrankia californiensis TaxID=1839754 RepID=UPI0013EA2FC2|nr:IS4 family transposase [Candidatus Protofrankia californiensis]
MLREAVLAGPGVVVTAQMTAGPLAVLARPAGVRAALAAGGCVDRRRTVLTDAVTTVLVVGLCLFSGEGYPSVLARLWPLLGAFNPAIVLGGPVSAVALSQARARLPAGVLRALVEAGARIGWAVETTGLRMFGLVVTAVDGTVFDLAATDAISERFATPSGGRFPQARVVTLVVCGTRRVLAAALDSCGVSEQALWDRLVTQLAQGTLNLADRNFFSMDRWRTAAGTGAHLAWRGKNGVRSLPATVIETLPDGSHLLRLRESDAMLARRRTTTGEKKAPRLGDVIARLVEFTVTVTDQAGNTRVSRFRVLTTLLDHQVYPAEAIAHCYAQRWQVELAYKTIKSTVRGPGRRLRGQSPDLAEQEICGLLAVYNALVDQAVAAAADLGIDPGEISFTVVLRAARDHLTSHAPCRACGHRSGSADLLAAIAAGPRNRADRQRSSPRTTKERRTQHTRNVTYTITITDSNLPRAA